MRKQADGLEQQSRNALRDAEKKYTTAVSVLKAVVDAAQKRQAGQKGNEKTTVFQKEWAEDGRNVGRPPRLPVEPEEGDTLKNEQLGYNATIEFINRHMLVSKTGFLYFSKKHQKMILIGLFAGEDARFAFAPSEMNPGIKFTEGGKTFFVEASNRKPVIEIFRAGKEPRFTDSLKLFAADQVDQQKLVKAWAHLIELCGGKPDPF